MADLTGAQATSFLLTIVILVATIDLTIYLLCCKFPIRGKSDPMQAEAPKTASKSAPIGKKKGGSSDDSQTGDSSAFSMASDGTKEIVQ